MPSRTNFSSSLKCYIATAQGVIAEEKRRVKDWYKENKLYIKGIILTLALLMTFYAALKLVKYIVSQDLLNKFIVAQVLGGSADAANNNSPAVSSNN